MANIITGFRIVCALALIFRPVFSGWFYVFYLLGGVSDVLDGIVARHLGKAAGFGARLDTIADIAFSAAVLIKVLPEAELPMWMLLWIAGIAVIKCIGMISGFVLYKRFFAEHTVPNKICGALLFAVPLCIGRLPRQASAVLMIVTCAAATIAAIWEGHDIRAGKEIG